MAAPWEKYSAAARQTLTGGPWSKYGQPPPTPDQTKAEAVERVSKERAAGFQEMPRFAEGLPFIGGLLDEATGVVQQGLHTLSGGRIGEPYEMGLELERERSKQADEANPAMSFTGKVGAGLAGFGGVAGAGDAVLSSIARALSRNPNAAVAPIQAMFRPAETVLGNVAKGATVGAGVGAAEGFTRGEGDVGGRLESAKDTAIGGAVLGGALPIAAAGVTRGYGAVSDLVSPTLTRMRSGPDAAADEILARRIASEGATPAQKRLDLQQGQNAARLAQNSQAELPETLADTSDAMQRLAGSVYRAGGEAGNLVKRDLQARQRGPDNPYGRQAAGAAPGQRQRALDTTERALLIRSSESARKTDRQIMAQQARDGNRLYSQARDQSEAFDLDPAIQGMALKAQQYPGPFAARLQRAINLFRQSGSQGNKPLWVDNIRRFDASKKALDDEIEKAQRAGSNNLVRELQQFKDDLLNAVHAYDTAGNPTRNAVYEQARRTWGTAAENREAIELGRAALRENAEITAEQYQALTAGQQTLFRLGFLESVRNAMGRTRPGSDATLLFQEPRVQQLMNAIIPTPRGKSAVYANRPERFGEVMRREGRMVQTRNAVIGGSPTQQRSGDDMQFAGDTLRGMWDRFRQAPGIANMAIEAVGAGIQRVFGYRQDVALALAQRLMTTDRAAQNAILNRLRSRGGPDVFARFANQIDQTALQLSASSMPALSDLRSQE
jgi:hypothetical protein